MTTTRMRFPIGRTVVTPGALEALGGMQLAALPYLQRHVRGDWGDINESDAEANEQALETGQSRIFSVYPLKNGERLWIITEWDRSVTTLLLASDY